MTLLESVPNLSTGRRAETVRELETAVISAGGAALLDSSSDPDHNRAVLTLAGEAPGLESALLSLARRAVETIDLSSHRGVHPRLGAIDVVPFVPLAGASMADAAAAARRTGEIIAAELAVPVFLYGHAARPERRLSLPELRRGGPAALAARMKDEEWAPDFGPRRPHPTAGVTAVGARDVLIAYNVVLATADLSVARAIAAEVREAGGGLPAVRALGLALSERALTQVSMNLLDFRLTPPRRAFAAVGEAAGRRGIEVVAGEIVGLVPAAAVEGVEGPEIGLDRLHPDQILENRLAAAGLLR